MVAQVLCRIPININMAYRAKHDESNLDSNLLIDTLLFLFNLLFKLLDRCSIRRGTVGLEDLDIPVGAS